MLQLVKNFCEIRGVTLRDAVASFGMPVERNNDAFLPALIAINSQACCPSSSEPSLA